MGWDSTWAKHWKKGRIDRKAECDDRHNWTERREDGTLRTIKVVKSQMVGSVYYAAVSTGNMLADGITPEVIGCVCLTKVRSSEIFVKAMDESCGPCQVECPKSILELLTPTDNEYAKIWREKCWENAKNNKKKALSKLKAGSIISFINPYEHLNSGIPKGEIIKLKKIISWGRRSKWISTFGGWSWDIKMIPDSFNIVFDAKETTNAC